jgi:hypothetical protein
MSDTHYVLLPRTPWAGPTAFQVGGPEIDLHRGTAVDTPGEPMRYELRVDEKADNPQEFRPLDLHDPGKGQLLMSPKLIDCLKAVPVESLQFFPAQVTYAPTGEAVDYQIANIVGTVSALDQEASDCEIDEDGFVETFFTLRLDPARVADHDLFRMYESFHTIIISRRVREALEAAKITGVQLLSQDEWQPGML